MVRHAQEKEHSSYLIKHLKELGTGLMNGTDDCPSSLSQGLHEGNDLEAGRAVQTTWMGHAKKDALFRLHFS